MSTKNRIAALGAFLAVMTTPALVSAQGIGNYSAPQTLLSTSTADTDPLSPKIARLKRKVTSKTQAYRQTRPFKVPTDAFGAAIAPGFQYGSAGMAYGTAV